MALDKYDMMELEEIASYVGLEKADGESWPDFAERVRRAYSEPILQAQYRTTIRRLQRLMD